MEPFSLFFFFSVYVTYNRIVDSAENLETDTMLPAQ